ncbi:MAG: hypothetical protein WC750_06105 [Patescibacteria group bacterium]|jgi:hypothetical protein
MAEVKMGINFLPFRKKKETAPIIDRAIEERNSNLNDIFNWQNNRPNPPAPVVPKKRK